MRIQHNIMALNAHRQLTGNTSAVQKNIEKLSSGYNINRAGDDASGLAISEKMRAQIKGLEVAQKNAQDGISLIQTAEGALTEVHSMLNRMVELAEKSANGTIQDDVDREAIQKEVDDLLSEIDRISKATNFNGINLLDGTLGATKADNTATGHIGGTSNAVKMSGLEIGTVVKFVTSDTAGTPGIEVGYNESNKELTITLTAATNAPAAFSAASINDAIEAAYASDPIANAILAGVKVDTGTVTAGTDSENTVLGSIIFKEAAASTKAKDVVGTDTDFVLSATKTGETGIDSFTFLAEANNQGVVNANGAVTITLDTNKEYSASEVTDMLRSNGIDWEVSFDGTLDGTQILAGFGAGAKSVTDGTGTGASGLTLQIGDTNESHQKVTVSVDNLSSDGLGISNLDVSTREAAGDAIQKIKDAINKVSTNRANLGGLQNRLEHTINNLSVTEENMTAAESRIRDVDMAREMMAFTKNNVLTQAAQAMLAQANTQPQSVLQLLQ